MFRYWISTLLLLCCLSLEAEQSVEKITILRSQDDWGPNEFIDSNGQLAGYHIDLIKLAAAELGVEVEFVSMPWKRVLNSMQDGLADAVSYVIHTPNREYFLIYKPGNVISQGSSRFAYLKDSGFHYNGDPESVKDLRIGVINGYNYGKQFERERFNQLIELNSGRQQLQMLLGKRVDLILVNIEHLRFKFGHTAGFDRIETADISSVSNDIYLAFSRKRGHDKLAERFARVIPRIRASKAFNQKVERYFQQPAD